MVRASTSPLRAPTAPTATSTSPLRACFKRRRACKVPPRAMILPADRTLSAPELAELSDEALLARAHADIVVPARERGVHLGLFGNHAVFPDEVDAAATATFFHAEEVRRASAALESFFENALRGVRVRSSAFKALAEESLGVGYVGNGEGIVACLLRGGAADFRCDDQHATLYLPLAPEG